MSKPRQQNGRRAQTTDQKAQKVIAEMEKFYRGLDRKIRTQRAEATSIRSAAKTLSEATGVDSDEKPEKMAHAHEVSAAIDEEFAAIVEGMLDDNPMNEGSSLPKKNQDYKAAVKMADSLIKASQRAPQQAAAMVLENLLNPQSIHKQDMYRNPLFRIFPDQNDPTKFLIRSTDRVLDVCGLDRLSVLGIHCTMHGSDGYRATLTLPRESQEILASLLPIDQRKLKTAQAGIVKRVATVRTELEQDMHGAKLLKRELEHSDKHWRAHIDEMRDAATSAKAAK